MIVQNLLEGRSDPLTVHVGESVRDALLCMSDHGYSQLPVVDSDGKASGMLTSESILHALASFGVTLEGLRVSDAMIDNTPTFRADEDLFNLLNTLRDHYAVPIVDRDDKVIGIVTNYDTTEYFRQRAQDIMLVEEIETTLKAYIFAAFTDEMGTVDQTAVKAAIEDITPSNRELRGPFRRALAKYFSVQGDANPTIKDQAATTAFD